MTDSSPVNSILVVDDDPFNQELLVSLLAHDGYRPVTVADGRAALEHLRAHEYDLVLLDIVMPEMDGFEVLGTMKRDPALRDIPVVMVSAVDEVESAARCIVMGAEDHLPKPFDPVLLRARVEAALTRKRLRDLEFEYLQQVGHVVRAAAAVEEGAFDPRSLDLVAGRPDALGQLARVFQRMAAEIDAREQRLRAEVRQLRIGIDQSRLARQVAEITESEYFRRLEARAGEFRMATGPDRHPPGP